MEEKKIKNLEYLSFGIKALGYLNSYNFEEEDLDDDDYYFEPHQAASVGEERLPLSGYKMSGDEHEAVVVHIPVKDRNLLKDLVRKFGWACVF